MQIRSADRGSGKEAGVASTPPQAGLVGVQVTCGRGRSLLSGRTQTGNDRLLVSQLPLVDSIFPPYFCIPLLPEDQLTSVPLLQSVPSVSSPLRPQRVLLAADQFPLILLQQVGGMRSLRRARVPPQVAVLQQKAGRREMSYFCIYCERGLPAQLSAGADRNRSAGDVLSRRTEIAAETRPQTNRTRGSFCS